MDSDTLTRDRLCDGLCLPIAPTAMTDGRFDPQRQRLLWNYYAAAGAGGAVADLTSGSADLRRELLASLVAMPTKQKGDPWLRIPLVRETEALSLADELRSAQVPAIAVALDEATVQSLDELIGLLQALGSSLPLMIYPQAVLSSRLACVADWQRLWELPQVATICLPAQRQAAVQIMRALADSGRKDVCAYTANELDPVVDLVTPFRYSTENKTIERRVVGGMLRLWGVFTTRASELLERCHVVAERGAIPDELLQVSVEVSELSAALAEDDYAGLREALTRHKLLADSRDADGKRPSQATLDRATTAIEQHRHLTDFAFVAARLEKWLEA